MAGVAGNEVVPAEAAGVDLTVHPSGIVPTLQNIVATVNLDTKLDLKTIALTARNAEYNPKVSYMPLCSVMRLQSSARRTSDANTCVAPLPSILLGLK